MNFKFGFNSGTENGLVVNILIKNCFYLHYIEICKRKKEKVSKLQVLFKMSRNLGKKKSTTPANLKAGHEFW